MKNSITVGIVVIAILLALNLSEALAGNESVNATMSANAANVTTEIARPQNCSALRSCVENCAQIQNCSMYLNCIENCTINASAGFGEATGVVVVKRGINDTNITSTNETKFPLPISIPNRPNKL